MPSIYFAHEREVFKRDGMLYAWREGTELIEGEEIVTETVRYRTVGDMSCTGGVRSGAETLQEVVLEIAATRSPSAARRARTTACPRRRWRIARRPGTSERPPDLLRFTTAGSVDDGKSTLIGRLLYDTQARSSRISSTP